MSQLPSPPETDSGFEGQMWPAESPPSAASTSSRSNRSRSGGRLLPILFSAVGLLIAIGVATFVVLGSHAPAPSGGKSSQVGEAPSGQPTEPDDVPTIKAPPGFTGYEEFDGVKTFTHQDTGFTLSIAPGWRLLSDAKLDKNTLMVVGDAQPSYSVASEGGIAPIAMLHTFPLKTTLAPPRFFHGLRQQLEGQNRTIGRVRLTIRLTGAGRTYVMRLTQVVAGLGEMRYTTYSVVRNERVYQIIFSVPDGRAAEYQSVFSRMAGTMTFEQS